MAQLVRISLQIRSLQACCFHMTLVHYRAIKECSEHMRIHLPSCGTPHKAPWIIVVKAQHRLFYLRHVEVDAFCCTSRSTKMKGDATALETASLPAKGEPSCSMLWTAMVPLELAENSFVNENAAEIILKSVVSPFWACKKFLRNLHH